jgi:hypothetical protein
MKTAIVLFGSYSNTYKLNEYPTDSDFYMSTFEPVPTDEYITRSLINSVYTPKERNHHLADSASFLRKDMVDNVFPHEKYSEYDIIIVSWFGDIITNIPTIPGKYITPMFVFSNRFPFSGFSVLNAITVVSGKAVRINGSPTLHMCDMDIQSRQSVFDAMYKGRVLDYTKDIPKFSDEYKATFLIPSVVRVTNNPLFCSQNRSVFTPEERFNQLLEQVKSVNKHGCIPIVLEGSELTLIELSQLSEYAYVVLFKHDKHGDLYANTHRNKSIYEVYVVEKLLSKITTGWVFKFGGRYKLTDLFDLSSFLKDKPVMTTVYGQFTYTNQLIAESILYSLPMDNVDMWKKSFKNMMADMLKNDTSIENMMVKYITEFHNVTTLGIIGRDGVMGMDKCL